MTGLNTAWPKAAGTGVRCRLSSVCSQHRLWLPHVRLAAGQRCSSPSLLTRESRCDVALSALPIVECVQTAAAQLPALPNFQAGVASVSLWVESAHPALYLAYFLLAGCGLPLSEDALVVWIGANIFRGVYESGQMVAFAVAMAYIGVTVSDMVSYGIGKMLQMGMAPWLKEKLMGPTFDRATNAIQKFGRRIGAVQRFILGFRWPLCVISGFTNVPAPSFAAGVCIGAVFTMSLQIGLGYLLRDNPSPYLTTLALVAGPQLFGAVIGPLFTGTGIWLAGRQRKDSSASSPTNFSPDSL